MKKLLSLLFIIHLISCSQESKQKDEIPSNTIYSVDFQKMENIEVHDKYKLLRRLYPIFDYMTDPSYWSTKALEDFYFVDIDGDNDLDAIFIGWSGAEPSCVRIFKDNNGAFIQVFDEFISINEMFFKNNSLYQLVIDNPGCCAEPRFLRTTFEFEIKNDDFKNKIVKRSVWFHMNDEPIASLKKPVPFETTVDESFLRLNKFIDPKDFEFPDSKFKSNVVATYAKGMKGLITATEKNDAGEIWHYVEMDPNAIASTSEMYAVEDFPTSIIGWMSDKELKIIK